MHLLPKTRLSVLIFYLLLVLPCATLVAQQVSPLNRPDATEAVVLWNHGVSGADSIDQESYAAMAASLGLPTAKLDLRDLDQVKLDEPTLLLVPQAPSRSLSSGQAQRIVEWLEKGGRLVAGGESTLLSALHFRLGKAGHVRVIVDRSLPGNNLHWADEPAVVWFAELPDGPTTILYADSLTGHPLGVTAAFGSGKYIVLAPYLDPLSGKGYSRFPTLVNAVARDLNCRPRFRRQGVDAYFDPADRLSMSLDRLVDLWKEWGIRAVHVSAWYYEGTQPFDYKTLIDAAHRNGILVYLWLEWPHIGLEFWNHHPEWREKNALLQDAELDWLHLMDLQNPDCMNAALEELSRELTLDWDGIDIAEFTITGAGGDALNGPSRPESFTNFGPTMRREFSEVAGFDPLELENPASEHFWKRDSTGLEKFYEFRALVNNRLLRQVVEFVVDLEHKGGRDWELIHTIVDNSLHPEFDRLFGFDLVATLKLLKEYNITLNVEDPYMEWDQPPIRYRRLRQTLASLLPGRSSMIDINIVPIHDETQKGFASAQATGAEFLQQLQTASERHGRVCVYSECSVFPQDWPLVPYAMSAGSTASASADGWEVRVPATVTFNVECTGAVFNNGKPWPCYGPEGIVLPAGKHHVIGDKAPADGNSSQQCVRMVAISGELLDAKVLTQGFEVTYSSPSRCLISLDASPGQVVIDGVETRVPVLKSRNVHVLLAPSGEHRLRVSGL